MSLNVSFSVVDFHNVVVNISTSFLETRNYDMTMDEWEYTVGRLRDGRGGRWLR